MKYYIYHIPGIKIGCTAHLETRMNRQQFTNWEILEIHEDIYVASDREIELQKEYGYPVDAKPYWKVVQDSTDNAKKQWVLAAKRKMVLTLEQAEEIRLRKNNGERNVDLQKEYGISKSTMQRILAKTRYEKVTTKIKYGTCESPQSQMARGH